MSTHFEDMNDPIDELQAAAPGSAAAVGDGQCIPFHRLLTVFGARGLTQFEQVHFDKCRKCQANRELVSSTSEISHTFDQQEKDRWVATAASHTAILDRRFPVWAKIAAQAAVLLVIVGGVSLLQAQAHARQSERLQRELRDREADVAKLEQELAALHKAAPVRSDEEVLRELLGTPFDLTVNMRDPRMIQVEPKTFVQEFFEKMDVDFDVGSPRTETKVLFYFRSTPPTAATYVPEVGGTSRLVRNVVRLYPTAHTMELMPDLKSQIRNGALVREFTVLATNEGVKLVGGSQDKRVECDLVSSSLEVSSSDSLNLDLVTNVSQAESESTSTIHILVRADGKGPWADQLRVLPHRFPVSTLSGTEKHLIRISSAAGLLGLPSDPVSARAVSESEVLPTSLEFLVVELSASFPGWSISKTQLDLDNPAARGSIIRDRLVLAIHWPKTDP